MILKRILSVILLGAGFVSLISVVGCATPAIEGTQEAINTPLSFDSIVGISTLINFLLLLFNA